MKPRPLKRLTLLAIELWPWDLRDRLPFDLGHDISIRDVSAILKKSNLDDWKECASSYQLEDIKRWSVCLCEQFVVPHDTSDELDEQSKRRLYFVAAHLRMIVPSKTNSMTTIQLQEEDGGWRMHSMGIGTPIVLEPCEVLAIIGWNHLEQLRAWMSWILKFEKEWKDFFPLHISMGLSEKACYEADPYVRYVTRVMALEALVSSDKVYGKDAIDQLGKLYKSVDLLVQYQSEYQPKLSGLVCDDKLLKEICILRNKNAHGQWPQKAWLERNIRRSNGRDLCHADLLAEAAVSLLSMLWRHIVSNGHQETFSNKKKMVAYFRAI